MIPTDGAVLDLMSSLHSNLAPDQRFGKLVGVGLNAQEMSANPQLTDHVVTDLNANPALPFADGVFDAAICTVSIDYLIRPVEVIREVGRTLSSGAPFAVTFSNRWFPPKVTRLWGELYPFERMGLVVRYFEEAGTFEDLETISIRGLPRPPDDPYGEFSDDSDPIFAVIGRRAGGQ